MRRIVTGTCVVLLAACGTAESADDAARESADVIAVVTDGERGADSAARADGGSAQADTSAPGDRATSEDRTKGEADADDAPLADADGPRRSVYTPIDVAKCTLLEENQEEAGYSRHECPGHAGYRYELIESDLRQNLILVRPGGARVNLDLSRNVANGRFSALGPRMEWRGADPARPETLTFRMNVAEPDPARPDVSTLVVVRLAPPVCIVAVVPPGATQSDDARRIADTPPYRCR